MKQIIFFYTFLLISFYTIAQKTFHLTVNMDTTIDIKKLNIYCDNGQNLIFATDSVQNNFLSIKGKYYSKYVTVHIEYDVNSSNAFYHEFWIADKKAILSLKKEGDGELAYNFKSVNAIDIYKANKKLYDNLKKYIIEESNNMSDLWKNSNQYENPSKFDSLHREVFISMLKKSSVYIKMHKDNYFYFWYFIDQYYKGAKIIFPKDTSLRLAIRDSLVSIFPKKIVSSFEGNKILQEIEVFLRPKINIASPLFKVNDISGNIIDINQFKGKYVLLDFWASWCPPCMSSMPLLKEIYKKHPKEKLTIIGINYDRDSTAFTNAVRKEQLNWSQVFDKDNGMMKLFGESALPTWILIDKEGTIIFNESGSDKLDKLIKLFDDLF